MGEGDDERFEYSEIGPVVPESRTPALLVTSPSMSPLGKAEIQIIELLHKIKSSKTSRRTR